MDFQTRITLLKVEASELAVSAVMSAMRACGLSGYRTDGEASLGRHLRDVLSAPIMINNDRILANLGASALLSDVPHVADRLSRTRSPHDRARQARSRAGLAARPLRPGAGWTPWPSTCSVLWARTGVYARTGAYEEVVQGLDRLITRHRDPRHRGVSASRR